MDNDKFGISNKKDYISDFKTTPAPAGPLKPMQPQSADRASQVQNYAAMKAQAEAQARTEDQPVATAMPVGADTDIPDLDSIDIVNDNSTPMPKPFVSTGKSQRSKKLVIILLVSLLVILLGAAGYIYWTRYYHKAADTNTQTNNTSATQEPESADSKAVLGSIDNKYGDSKVLPEKFSDKTNYPLQYVTYDSEGRYYIRDTDTWQYYNLGDSPQVGSTSGCDSAAFKAKYGEFFDFTQQAFSAAGFEISNPKSGNTLSSGIYSQYNDCGSSLVAKSAAETCSVYLRESVDVSTTDTASTKPKAVASVACSTIDAVTPEIAKITEINQVLTSAGQTNKFNTQGLDSIVYYKDSLTPGYKIAAYLPSDASETPNYYYQKATANWASANETGKALNCDTDNADIKAAFKGESCTVKDALSGNDIKSVF